MAKETSKKKEASKKKEKSKKGEGDEADDTKKKKKAADDGKGKCVISPEAMKCITLVTLLVSDFDICFTVLACCSFMNAGGNYVLMIGVIAIFFVAYVAGCVLAALEANKFVQRFKDKVKLGEIAGITLEDLNDCLDGKRIFWMGKQFELAKRRKVAIDMLKMCTPESIPLDKIDIPTLEKALAEATDAGVDEFQMPSDSKFGAKAIEQAQNKVKAIRAAKAKKGEGSSEAEIEPAAAPPVENTDAQYKEIQTEIAKAGDNSNLVRMLTLASVKQIDSYRIPDKLLDKKGKVTDTTRALFNICESKGLLQAYYQVSRSFTRRVIKPQQSVPYWRLMVYGWQPSVESIEFAGILNANALYSFTVGFPQIFFSLAFLFRPEDPDRLVYPCEDDVALRCTMMADFNKPNVQSIIVLAAMVVSILSLGISLVNIVVDFPAQLFAIAEAEEEDQFFAMMAEADTKKWVEKIQMEVTEDIKTMLKVSSLFEANKIQGQEAPMLVIEDVIKLERKAMERRVQFMEYFLVKSDKMRARKKKEKERKKNAKEGEAPMEESTEDTSVE